MIDRALTAGGNKGHNIERIVAYFQRGELVDLDTEGSADFLAREFDEGGKGVKIAGRDYALWFSKEGFRIAPGRSAFGPGGVLVPWDKAAQRIAALLLAGQFAAREKIEAAQDKDDIRFTFKNGMEIRV